MPSGCIHPSAVNFDPLADSNDGSCIWLEQVDGVCYKFTEHDLEDRVDHSFTMSFSVEGDNWVFFHDYIPDYYFHTREKLHLIKNSTKSIYTANAGPVGRFLGATAKSFFVDVVFRSDQEMTLNSLNWVSEMLDRSTEVDSEFATLSHITIWNSYQCTGRIAVSQLFDGQLVNNIRRTKSEWNFDDFRDLVKTRGSQFLADIFSDFAVDTTKIDSALPWWEKKLIEDMYFIVRFEFNNSSDKVVLLHEVNADVTPSER